ncbi:hypothetical protein C0995_012264 [Termitomyces sp. Mi166|nr:hypothetical protein C0995_012264 [Termitomyces sp. Mi166\
MIRKIVNIPIPTKPPTTPPTIAPMGVVVDVGVDVGIDEIVAVSAEVLDIAIDEIAAVSIKVLDIDIDEIATVSIEVFDKIAVGREGSEVLVVGDRGRVEAESSIELDIVDCIIGGEENARVDSDLKFVVILGVDDGAELFLHKGFRSNQLIKKQRGTYSDVSVDVDDNSLVDVTGGFGVVAEVLAASIVTSASSSTALSLS